MSHGGVGETIILSVHIINLAKQGYCIHRVCVCFCVASAV